MQPTHSSTINTPSPTAVESQTNISTSCINSIGKRVTKACGCFNNHSSLIKKISLTTIICGAIVSEGLFIYCDAVNVNYAPISPNLDRYCSSNIFFNLIGTVVLPVIAGVGAKIIYNTNSCL